MRPIFLACLGYLGIVLFICSGLLADLHHRIVYFFLENMDMVQNIWHCWYTNWAFSHHLSLTRCPLINYPYGALILEEVGNNYDQVLSVPFQRLLGFPAYYNVMVILQMFFNALAGYVFIRRLCRDDWCAFFGGAAFAFNPYYLHELTVARHPPTHMYWIPLFLLFLWKTREERSWMNPLAAGVILALACWSYWFYGYFLIILTVMFLAAAAWRYLRPGAGGRVEAARRLKSFWGRILLMGGVFLAAVAPYAGFFVSQAARGQLSNAVMVRSLQQFSDKQLNDALDPASLVQAWPVLLAIALAIWLFRRRGMPWFWVSSAALFGLLSLGPVLKWGRAPLLVGGSCLGLPFQWLAAVIPYYNRLEWPSRHLAIYGLSLAVLGALALAAMRESPLRKGRGAALALGVGVSLGVVLLAWLGGPVSFPHPRVAWELKLGAGTAILLIFWAWMWGRLRLPGPYPVYRWLAGVILVAGILGTPCGLAWSSGGYPLTQLPLRTSRVLEVSPFYLKLAADSAPGALMELPLTGFSALYFQIYHHQPIAEGMRSENLDPAISGKLSENTFLQYLGALGQGLPAGEFSLRDRDEMTRLGFRFLVIRRASFPGEMPAQVEGGEEARGSQVRVPIQPVGGNVHLLNRGGVGKVSYPGLVDKLRPVLGPPVYQDRQLTVFGFRPATRAP